MGYEESLKHILGLSYRELQSLCKKHNLPTNKPRAQLASSIALMLEASGAKSPAPLSNLKEAATCSQVKNKRGAYSGRDDDRTLVHAKHHKGHQTPIDGTSKGGMDTSISPVSMNYGRQDNCGRPSSEPTDARNVQSQSAVGTANKSANPEPASDQHGRPANIVDQISAPIIQKHPVIDKGCELSAKRSASAGPVQFFVTSDEGLDLVVDLNFTPSDFAENLRAQACIPPYSEPGNASSFISSLVSKDGHSTISPSGNIVVDIQSKGSESIAPSTNSSLGSDACENSRSEPPCPADTTTVNSVSYASTLPGTLTELSRYQEGAQVVSSSCLTVQNNMTSDMTPGALDNELLPPGSVNVLVQSERAPLLETSVQPTGNKDTISPGKTKDSVKTGCPENILVDTDNVSIFSSGHGVRSDSYGKSAGKQTLDVPAGTQVAHNGDNHEVLLENELMEEDTGCGDRLSISCQLAKQTVTQLPVTDAQSDASSAGRCTAGNFDLTNPTSSSAASDNAVNPLTSKYGAESAQSQDSADKKRECDPEELEELESEMPPAYGEPARNILLSLRSASARQTKPRRSPRLIPK